MQILNLQKQIFPHTQIRTSIHYDLGTRVCAFEVEVVILHPDS